MKPSRLLPLLWLCFAAARGEQVHTNPLGSVLKLLSDLSQRVQDDGSKEDEAYRKYASWCDDSAANSKFALEAATKLNTKLEASVEKLNSDIEVASSRIDDLASSIANADSEAKKAKAIRDKEHADYKAGEEELMEMIDALGRAVGVLEKEGAAALAQVDTANMANMVHVLGTMLEAASFPTSDRSKLLALVQSKEAADDEDTEADAALGAPKAAAYKSQDGSIVEILEDMKEDADSQLAKLRKAEVEAKHQYEMLKQSSDSRLEADKKDLANQKGDRAKATEDKSTAEGDLQMAAKDMKYSTLELEVVQGTCVQTAADHEKSVDSRKEELRALSKATEILQETAKGAPSFVQVASTATASLSKFPIVAAVKRLAKKHHSAALAQLASRIAAVIGSGASSDPFASVKKLIKEMINKLSSQARADASEKAYCDKELERSEYKQDDLNDEVAKMTSTVDSAVSKSAQLKEQVKELQGELAALTKEQAELDKIRSESHAAYKVAKADLEEALHGVRQALGVLRDYYGGGSDTAAMLQEDSNFDSFMQQPAAPEKHSASDGAGTGLIAMLEVIEADFAKNLVKVEMTEADELSDYEKMTNENQVTKVGKEQDVKYTSAEIKGLDTTLAENSEDRETENTELAAIQEYLAKLKDRCVAKPSTYEERAKRRESEIEGLKEALAILRDEAAAAFLQHQTGRRGLRGHSALTVATTL